MLPLLLVLLALLGGCASPATNHTSSASNELEAQAAKRGIFPEIRATRVTFVDHKTGSKVGLFNEALTSKAEYYSKVRNTATYKVVPNLDMGALLKQLDELDFFQKAERNSRRVRGARMTIQIERDGDFWTMAYVSGGTEDDFLRVQQCSIAVQALYNAHASYQQIDNERGVEFFQDAIDQFSSQGSNHPKP
ncbi:MAG: hypothetical protein MK213_03085 [Planctomycetes bacterium]|nr:hypothetical protein [Planctomycetota bacterium]